MEQVTFGDTGLRVSRIGLGGYPFSGVNRARDWDPYSTDGQRTVSETIHRALDVGFNYIDTAPGYGDGHSERLIGEVIGQNCGQFSRAELANTQRCPEELCAPVIDDAVATFQRCFDRNTMGSAHSHASGLGAEVDPPLSLLSNDLADA